MIVDTSDSRDSRERLSEESCGPDERWGEAGVRLYMKHIQIVQGHELMCAHNSHVVTMYHSI